MEFLFTLRPYIISKSCFDAKICNSKARIVDLRDRLRHFWFQYFSFFYCLELDA